MAGVHSEVDGLEVLVASRTDEADGIACFELRSRDESVQLPAFSAGAHIDVVLGSGFVRQYSLCNDPRERHRYLIAVLKEPASRGGSRAMHEAVQAGQSIRIGIPRNHFPLVAHNGRALLLAAGIGITPILAMAEELHALGTGFDLHYLARNRGRAAFVPRLVGSAFSPCVHFHFSEERAIGREDLLKDILKSPDLGTHVYVCGPQRFTASVQAIAAEMGWREGQIHWELFGASVSAGDNDKAFELDLVRSGKRLQVPSGKTPLQALLDAGVDMPYSCEQGVCGSCCTKVVAGTPDHRDFFLTDQERDLNDRFMPCCSRAVSSVLSIDL